MVYTPWQCQQSYVEPVLRQHKLSCYKTHAGDIVTGEAEGFKADVVSWCCLDYPSLINVLLLRLFKMRRKLQDQATDRCYSWKPAGQHACVCCQHGMKTCLCLGCACTVTRSCQAAGQSHITFQMLFHQEFLGRMAHMGGYCIMHLGLASNHVRA